MNNFFNFYFFYNSKCKKEIDFFLYDSFRVLKKNGINIIATPSLDKIVKTCYFRKTNKKYL